MKPETNTEESQAVSPETLPLGGASCSPSSDTPETDMVTHLSMSTLMNAESWEKAWRAMATHARKLERARNKERALADLLAKALNATRWDSPVLCDGAMKSWEVARKQSPENDERMHHYQRRRASNTGLGLKLRERM